MAYPGPIDSTCATTNVFWHWTVNITTGAVVRAWRAVCDIAIWMYDAIRPAVELILPQPVTVRYLEAKVLHLFQRNIHKEHGRFIFT